MLLEKSEGSGQEREFEDITEQLEEMAAPEPKTEIPASREIKPPPHPHSKKELSEAARLVAELSHEDKEKSVPLERKINFEITDELLARFIGVLHTFGLVNSRLKNGLTDMRTAGHLNQLFGLYRQLRDSYLRNESQPKQHKNAALEEIMRQLHNPKNIEALEKLERFAEQIRGSRQERKVA